jgi:spermidine synthase
MALDDNWFTEECIEGGSAISLKIKDKVHDEQSPYQRIEVYQTETYGKLLTLDGLVMLTDRDNFVYHEMMSHPALFTHPDPKRILIIGGGDCGTLREVLKHPTVEKVDMVELDERVTRVAERFFPELCELNNDPRAQLHFTDGIQWVAGAEPGSYDAIIVDSTDPVGPAAGLFSLAFYKNCHRSLDDHGMLIGQSESPLFHLSIIKNMATAMRRAGFQDIATLAFPQTTYPSGWWSATMACKNGSVTEFRRQAAAKKEFATRYYNHDIHAAALAMPEFMRHELKNERIEEPQ